MHLKLFLVCALLNWILADGVVAERNERSESRIVGGRNATKAYPYQVSIEVPRLTLMGIFNSWYHICGGSIITEHHILTAAHCVVDKDKKQRPNEEVSVLVGTQILYNGGGTRYRVCESKFHPKYLSSEAVNYDIAIIATKGAITLIPGQIEVIPYTNEWTEANVTCVLTGWGSMVEYRKGPYPTTLQETQVSTMTHEDCYNKYNFITKNNLCSIPLKGEGGCDGDSGGPLVDEEKNIQVGVITYVNGGCGMGQPDFYSRVSAFHDWIQHSTNGRQCGDENSTLAVTILHRPVMPIHTHKPENLISSDN